MSWSGYRDGGHHGSSDRKDHYGNSRTFSADGGQGGLLNERLEHNDLRRPQSGNHGFNQREGRGYISHNKLKTDDVYSPRDESNTRDRPLSREKSHPPNASAGYAMSHDRRPPSRNLDKRPRESEQTAEDMNKTQSSGSREGPRATPRAWDEYLRKNTEEETGYSSHSKQSSAGVYSPREVSSPRERDNAHRSRPVNSNPPDPNAGHSRFHRHTSSSRKSDEAQKSDRNKHGESQQTAGNSSNAQSSGSQSLRQAKPQAWEEFLRKKREEEAKVSQRSQRTKDYADERNKAIKGDSKPTEDSGDKVDEPEGSSSSKVTALTLDDVMIGRRNYMADDEMIETMSQVTTISSVFNLSKCEVSVTIAYNGIEYNCGECSCMNKDLKVTESHVRNTHKKKAAVVRYHCTLCKFKTERLESWKDHEGYSYHKNLVQKERTERQKTRSNSSQRPTEKHKLVDEAGFTVPHQRAKGHGIKRTGGNDPWSKKINPLWNQRSTEEVDNNMTPWNKKQKNSPESSADKKPAETNNMDACKILFSSKAPPWEKKPVLDIDSVAATSVPHLNLARPPVSTFDTVSRQSATSSLLASERPSSSSPTIVQRANVSSAASTESKDKPLHSNSVSSVKHSSEQHKIAISQSQNKHGARIPSTLVPGKNPSNITTCSGPLSSTKTSPRNPVPVYSSSAATGTTLSSVSKIKSSCSVQGKGALESSSGVTSKTKSGISISNAQKNADRSPSLQSVTSPDQRSPRSQGQSQVSGNKARHNPDHSSSPADHNRRYTVPKVNQSSKTATTITSATATVAHTGANKAIGNTRKKPDSAAVKPIPAKSTSNQYSKTTTATTTDVDSAGVSKPISTMQKKLDSATGTSASSKTSNQYSKTATTTSTTTTTYVDSAGVSKPISAIPKKSDSAAGKATSNQYSKTTTTAVVSADVSKNISTMQKKPDSAAVKSASSKTIPNVPNVSGDLLGKILPTLPYNSPSRPSQGKSHSTDTRTGHASAKTLKSLSTKQKPLVGRHERSRHGSGTGSAGPSSPLLTEKPPSDRETVKSASISKTTLGIKEKNAVYDPRQNVVPLSSARNSKTSEKQHIEGRQRSNSSRQEVSGTKGTEKSTNMSGMKSSSSAAKPAKVQQPVTRTPVEIQDPRKVTHSSKLSHGALTIKPISGFKIPKQKTMSDSENSVDELVDEKMKNSDIRKSPKKKKKKKDKDGLEDSADELCDEIMKKSSTRKSPKKKKKKKDKDEKGISTASKNNTIGTSTEKKDRSSSKHGQLKEHARDNMSCESVSTRTTFGEQFKITRHESTDKSSSVAKISTAKNIETGERSFIGKCKPSSDDSGEKNNNKKRSLHIESSDDSSLSEPENETNEAQRKLHNDFSAHSTNERVKLITPKNDYRKSTVENRKESVSGSETGKSGGNRKDSTPSTADKDTRRTVAVTLDKDRKKNDRNIFTDTRELNISEKVNNSKRSEFTGSTSTEDDTTSVQRGFCGNQSPANETSEVRSVNIAPKVFDSPPWAKQSILGLDLPDTVNTSETSPADGVGGSTMLQRPVKGANQPETPPKARVSTTKEAPSSAVSEQTCQVSVSSASQVPSQASSSHESEARLGENEVFKKTGPKHENSFVEIDEVGRMLCWKCNGKVFPKCSSTAVSSHLREAHMKLTSALYECTPCDYTSDKCREFQGHMKTAGHTQNLRQAMSRKRPSDNSFEMLTAGENPHGSFPQMKVKVEDTHETSMTSAPTSTTNTAEKQIMNETNPSAHSESTEQVVKLLLKVESDSSDEEPEQKAGIRVKIETPAFISPSLPLSSSSSEQKAESLKKCPCSDETYVHIHCPQCGITAKSPSAMRDHRLTQHGIIPEGQTYRCPLDDCSGVYLYPSGLKKHIAAHIKKEKNLERLHYLETQLKELETFVRPRRSKVKLEIPPKKNRRQKPIKIPRTIERPKGQKKLIAWYVRRKKRLLKDFGMTNSGRNSLHGHIRDRRLLRKYICIINNQEVFKCKRCDKIMKTSDGFKYHTFAVHNIKRRRIEVGNSSNARKSDEIEGTRKSVEKEEKKTIQKFLQIYKKGDRYHCDKCFYDTSPAKQGDFREHMYKKHNVFEPNLRHYECNECTPVFRTIKQNKMEAHLVSASHIKTEKAKMTCTSTEIPEELDDTCSKSKLQKHELGVRHKKTVELKASKKRGNDDDEIDIELVRKKPKVSPTAQKKNSKSYVVTFSGSEIFRCDPCKLSFNAINDVGNHIDTNHREETSMFLYKCKICTITENNLTNFREHMKTEDHELEVALVRSKAEYEASKRKVSGMPQSETPVYQVASSESEESGDEGVETVFGVTDKGLSCVTCKFATKIFAEIIGHIADRHHRKKDKIVFDCEVCNFKCSRAEDALIHITSDGHETNMNDTFWEYAKITTDIVYKITRKDRIVCTVCKRKIFTINRLLTHAKDRHELPSINIRIVCILCNKILVPAEIENHRKTANHLRLVEKEVESSETDSSPPSKKPRLEEIDASASFEQQIAEERLEPDSRQLEAEIEEFPEESPLEIVPEQHDEPPSVEGAVAEVAPPQQPALPPQRFAPALRAPAPPPFVQPYRQVSLAHFTTRELLEELCTRDDYYTCPCGFAYHKDKVASYLHKSCHAVNDWHKCSNCYKRFPDAYSFITHLFCKEGKS